MPAQPPSAGPGLMRRLKTSAAAVAAGADAVLRAGTAGSVPAEAARGRRTSLSLLGYLLLAGLFYGAVMGGYGLRPDAAAAGAGPAAGRWLQLVYSGAKVPLLLLVTFGLSLPNFWVINLLLGVGADFRRALRALLAAQAGLTLVLAALAPFTLLWYASFADYHVAILFNAAMFAVASFSAQILLRRAYRPLIERNPTHRTLLRFWIVIYAFVGIQMGWILRPFIGDPSQPVQFFRSGSWGNAYVVVAEMVWKAARETLGF